MCSKFLMIDDSSEKQILNFRNSLFILLFLKFPCLLMMSPLCVGCCRSWRGFVADVIMLRSLFKQSLLLALNPFCLETMTSTSAYLMVMILSIGLLMLNALLNILDDWLIYVRYFRNLHICLCCCTMYSTFHSEAMPVLSLPLNHLFPLMLLLWSLPLIMFLAWILGTMRSDLSD